MARYKNKPLVVDAIRYETKDDHIALLLFVGARYLEMESLSIRYFGSDDEPRLKFKTPNNLYVWDKLHKSWILVLEGQWIIKGITGEFYPCADEVFRETYEEVLYEE